MVKARKEETSVSAEQQAAAEESKRLRDLAVSRGLLAQSKASPPAPLLPSKTIRKCVGKDIVKKGNRKTKYLFAFPGLLAPISGGKFGELTHLDSRNPILYIDFPNGRLKLFGTIVYPKTKYLTMLFLSGKGDISCDDCFESLVVFPETWWIGTKEENPEEFRLPFPTGPQQVKHSQFDFNAGAGCLDDSGVVRTVKDKVSKLEIEAAAAHGKPGGSLEQAILTAAPSSERPTPTRQSARNVGKKTSYAVSSSEEEEEEDEQEQEDASESPGQVKSGRITTVKKNILQTKLMQSSVEEMLSGTSVKTEMKQGKITGFMLKKTELVEISESSEVPQKQKQGRHVTSRKISQKKRLSITQVSSESAEELATSYFSGNAM